MESDVNLVRLVSLFMRVMPKLSKTGLQVLVEKIFWQCFTGIVGLCLGCSCQVLWYSIECILHRKTLGHYRMELDHRLLTCHHRPFQFGKYRLLQKTQLLLHIKFNLRHAPNFGIYSIHNCCALLFSTHQYMFTLTTNN